MQGLWIAPLLAAYAPAPVPTRTSGIRMAEDLNGLAAPLAGQTPLGLWLWQWLWLLLWLWLWLWLVPWLWLRLWLWLAAEAVAD